MAIRPGVLMVTGAYHPELSGAGLQCRALVRRLRDEVDFTVLTTTANRSLPSADIQDEVPVYRVWIDPASWWSKAIGTLRVTWRFVNARRRFSIMHLHGFSQKSMLLVCLAMVARKRIGIKLTSVGHDDPVAIADRGHWASWCYTKAEAYFAVSPRLVELYRAAGLPPARVRLIPNGVDLERFRPPADGERELLRRELSISGRGAVVLFVGFFSRDKRPDLLFDAWAAVSAVAPDSVLLFVGATRSPYYEVDAQLAAAVRHRAAALGVTEHLRFIEATHEIERFHRAADVFVLPSVREGLPNALLEAMASGTACIATRLEGVTDSVIQNGHNGLLVPPDDPAALEGALQRLLGDSRLTARLGREARRTVEAGYGLDRTAAEYLTAYRDLLKRVVEHV